MSDDILYRLFEAYDELGFEEVDRRIRAYEEQDIRHREFDRFGEWWTAQQAAERFNVTVREIHERYRPLMPRGYVLPPESSLETKYEFEQEDFDWDKYIENMPTENMSTDVYNRAFDCAPETALGYVPGENEDDAVIMTGRYNSHHVSGYDEGLEPSRRRRIKGEAGQWLYLAEPLLLIRAEKENSRRIKDLPPRNSGGRFAKKSA